MTVIPIQLILEDLGKAPGYALLTVYAASINNTHYFSQINVSDLCCSQQKSTLKHTLYFASCMCLNVWIYIHTLFCIYVLLQNISDARADFFFIYVYKIQLNK